LDHVPQGAGAVVVAGTPLQRQVLVEKDFHLFHVLPVPHRLQEVVREPQAQDVEDRGLAQEVVHPVDVVLRDEPRQRLVEGACGLLAGAERLLHHQPGTGRNLPGLKRFAGQLADPGRKCEVHGHRAFKAAKQSCQGALGRDIHLVVHRLLLQQLQGFLARLIRCPGCRRER